MTKRPEEQVQNTPQDTTVFSECPLCGNRMYPEHAHFKCRSCGFRDSCCDG